jgi:hypothetical protein
MPLRQRSFKVAAATAPWLKNRHLFLDINSASPQIKLAAEKHVAATGAAYVDVAVLRWQDFTGKSAVLEGDGRACAPARRTTLLGGGAGQSLEGRRDNRPRRLLQTRPQFQPGGERT